LVKEDGRNDEGDESIKCIKSGAKENKFERESR
jgi:hypothetical protein